MQNETTLALLAGGRGRRMGGHDKGLVSYRGQPLAEYVLEQLEEACPIVPKIIVANRNLPFYRSLGCPVISDIRSGFLWPMVGILSAMEAIETEWLLVWPTDAPMVCSDILRSLMISATCRPQLPVHVPVDLNGRYQPLFALYHRSLIPSMCRAIKQGHLALTRWVRAQPHETLKWSNELCFTNLNTPAVLSQLEQIEQSSLSCSA
ncbi:molybdenum cofactor guanylyltransferase [Alcanivorax sp.]|uniref:molybdenum cofactor guanylyltransferase n=1 Tax=Alcanivorax sp. TaxID=1872427 RepID=UPI002587CAB7|nr:molybdenum cofactor guanylyltransferase [Alcanivorax sp.]